MILNSIEYWRQQIYIKLKGIDLYIHTRFAYIAMAFDMKTGLLQGEMLTIQIIFSALSNVAFKNKEKYGQQSQNHEICSNLAFSH